MRAKYLLPCPCGRTVPIDVGQSGQTVDCPCGRRLDVPTMLEIRSLERVPQESAPPAARQSWGLRERLLLLGAAIVLGAGCLALGLYFSRPRPPRLPSPEWFDLRAERLTLIQTFIEWEQLGRGLDTASDLARQAYKSDCAAYHRWLAVVTVIGLLGLACAASSLLVSRSAPDGGDPLS